MDLERTGGSIGAIGGQPLCKMRCAVSAAISFYEAVKGATAEGVLSVAIGTDGKSMFSKSLPNRVVLGNVIDELVVGVIAGCS